MRYVWPGVLAAPLSASTCVIRCSTHAFNAMPDTARMATSAMSTSRTRRQRKRRALRGASNLAEGLRSCGTGRRGGPSGGRVCKARCDDECDACEGVPDASALDGCGCCNCGRGDGTLGVCDAIGGVDGLAVDGLAADGRGVDGLAADGQSGPCLVMSGREGCPRESCTERRGGTAGGRGAASPGGGAGTSAESFLLGGIDGGMGLRGPCGPPASSGLSPPPGLLTT